MEQTETIESLLTPFRPTFRGQDIIDVNATRPVIDPKTGNVQINPKTGKEVHEYILKLPRPLAEYKIDPITKMMPQNGINKGLSYVIFHRVSNIGTSNEVHDRIVWSLDGVTGTLDHILYYSRKPGWKILDFGNFRLNKEEKGVYSDAVEEHIKIYQHCVQQIGLSINVESMATGFKRKLSELELANESKEKLIAKQQAELDALRAKMREGK